MALNISLELSHQCPLDQIKDHAKVMDTHDFFRVWVPDTLVSPWEAWLAASLILHHTQKIQIGLGVTNPYTRHPVVMAQMAATFQELSHGRLALALGKGLQRFLEKAGIGPTPSCLEEYVMLLNKFISGERINFSGQAFSIQGIHLRTLPPQTGVPLFLAATNPETWQTAIDSADGVTTFWSPPAVKMNQQAKKAKSSLYSAALIPFSLTQPSFFKNTVTSLDDLKNELTKMQEAGFNEAVIAYSDRKDLEALAQLRDFNE